MANELLFRRSLGHDRGWRALYQSCFPAEERVPMKTLLSDLRLPRLYGKLSTRLLHESVSHADRRVDCFSLVFTKLTDMWWLSYIATREGKRGNKIGESHLQNLIKRLQMLDPSRKGLLLEIESPTAPDLDVETEEIRRRRMKFYVNLGAKSTPVGIEYLMPNFVDGQPPIAAKLLWFELGAPITNGLLKRTIVEVYERIYRLDRENQLIARIAGQFKKRY